jgi:hypothetical protein
MFKAINHLRRTTTPQPSAVSPGRASLPSSYAPVYTQIEPTPPAARNFLHAIVSRLPGFRGRFEKTLSPIVDAATVGDMKRAFQGLAELTTLAAARPQDTARVFEKASQSRNALYVHLAAIACGMHTSLLPALALIPHLKGNHALVLECLRTVAPHRPHEAHLLTKKLFKNTHIPTDARLHIFRELAMTKGFADKGLLTGGFEMLMAGATPHERNRHIYPSLMNMVERWRPLDNTLRVHHAMVGECLRGWISGCQIITDDNHTRAQKLLMMPPSARG